MTNKTMRTNIKQKGYKVLAAILAASTVIGTATPAFASEEIPAAAMEAVMEDNMAYAGDFADSDYEIAYDLENAAAGSAVEEHVTEEAAADEEAETEEAAVDEEAETEEAAVEEETETEEAAVEEEIETEEAAAEEEAETEEAAAEEETETEEAAAEEETETEEAAAEEETETEAAATEEEASETENFGFRPFANHSFLVSFEGNNDPAVREGSKENDTRTENQAGNPFAEQFEDLGVDRDKEMADMRKQQENDELIAKANAMKAKEAAKKKAKEQAVKEAIDEAGRQMGTFVNNVIDGKYSDRDEAIRAFGHTTLTCINNCLIKNIPYIGAFTQDFIAKQLGDVQEEDPTITRLEGIGKKLDAINETIQKCSEDVIDNQNFVEQNTKVAAINDASTALYNKFSETNKDFQKAMILLNNKNGDSQSTEQAFAALDKIYTSRNKSLLNQYVEYVKALTNSGQQIKASEELSPDLMGAFRNIVTHGKTGDSAIVEFEEERKALVDNVQDVNDYSYEVLNTILTAKMEKYEIMRASCEKAKAELSEQLKNASDEQKKSIQAAISKLRLAEKDATAYVADLKGDLKKLDQANETLSLYLERERISMKYDNEACKSKEHKTELEFANHKFKSEQINGVDTYVSVSADEKQIEYRDYYGNLLGTRSVDETASEVNQYQVKAGSVYRLERGGFETINWSLDDVNVLVDEVKEVPCTGFLGFGTIRTIYGRRVDDNGNICEEGTWTIGGRGAYNVFERKVGEMKSC